MNPWIAFLIGLLLGWLIEWIIDWFFWRKGTDDSVEIQAKLTAAEERITELEAELKASRTSANEWQAKYTSVERDCQGRLNALDLEWREKYGDMEKDLDKAKLAAGLGLAGTIAASIDSDEIEIEARLPEVDLDLDPVDVDLDIDADVPEIDIDLEPVDVDVDIPEGELDLPNVDLELPGLGLAGAAAAVGMASRGNEVEIDLDTPDNLRLINGVGPRFEEKLNAGGVYRFDQMAAMEPGELEAIIQPKDWQKFDYASWIAQAAVLGGQPRMSGGLGDDLTRIEGIGPKYNSLLNEAGITTFEQVGNSNEADLEAVIQAPSWRNVNYNDWIAQAKFAAAGDEAGLIELQDQLNNRKANNIRLINGMGEKYASALEAAGLGTFAAIAAASPEELQGITENAGLRTASYDEWIAEAKLRAAGKRVSRNKRKSSRGGKAIACPQDLSAVKGIGRVYEQRLYQAGIGSYWELSEVGNADLSQILEVEGFQDVQFDEIKADARRLAEETETVGRVWDGTEPDDFEILDGIGEVLEGRLYAAGICTFEALAQLSETLLAEICKAPAMNRPNYAGWLEIAKQHVAEKGE